MVGCRTSIFTDPDAYRVPGASINLTVTGRGDFKARLTTVKMGRLTLARGEENVPRVAFVTPAAGRVFVSFPTRHDPPPIWNGVEMRQGEILLHGSGERLHQCTSEAGGWGLISLAWEDLADYGRALGRVDLTPPTGAKILSPPSKAAAKLRHLHAQVRRIAETEPHMIERPKVALAFEHDLLHAFVDCLALGEAHPDAGARQRYFRIMGRLEDVLASNCYEQLSLPELCAAVGVRERTLRKCCTKFLGMSPNRYVRMRRLNLVRAALRRAYPATVSIEATARLYGFSELGRFAAAYRMLFGELPSVTLRAAPKYTCSPARAEFA